ncbi:PTS system mannose/fructose/sorbose family transporter subunit IID [Bombilactobacillus bombi]|uniref:PTS system mannose/fructose/sorbose family transporter subunit IID n=1 Tax=Bombilactobacillus bombi TaxID=1303590 RepID=UPI0015E5E955|nr:PTS system mannose/fructose/sorbose family transporter subunit IID [Bombilactobacillus bombi]MBA1433853.1 PTS system mannose/fructose/sorbose family transporter subunit IID [Bombilactobacillus bombi]
MISKNESKIGKKEIRQLFWRSMPMEASFSYERMMSMAYAYCMYPIIKKLYPKLDDQKKAMHRHLEFFNCTSACSPIILGISTAMEERNAYDPNFDTDSINAMKAGLMGPLSGIGDAIFWGSLRIITAGIGISLAKDGNWLGPVLFVLLFNIPNYLFRYYGVKYGYSLGNKFISKIDGSLMDNITYAINILGMAVIGAMIASMVSINIPITFGGGKHPQTVQSLLNSIMPCLLPLGLTFYISHLLKKKYNILIILLVIIIISIFGAYSGILAVPKD